MRPAYKTAHMPDMLGLHQLAANACGCKTATGLKLGFDDVPLPTAHTGMHSGERLYDNVTQRSPK
jgi:hypothetical protein